MKDNKTVFLQIRLTPGEKEFLKEYAEKHGTTITELVRQGLAIITNKEAK